MYKTIETDRLRIRPIALSDADFVLKLVNSEGWLKFIGDRNIANEQDAEKYIQKILDNALFYYSVFELKSTGQAIGLVTFLNRDNLSFPDIGYAMLPEFEGMSYALEASKCYLSAVIDNGTHENIVAITRPNNQKSINLLNKLGLHYAYDYQMDDKLVSLFSLKALK